MCLLSISPTFFKIGNTLLPSHFVLAFMTYSSVVICIIFFQNSNSFDPLALGDTYITDTYFFPAFSVLFSNIKMTVIHRRVYLTPGVSRVSTAPSPLLPTEASFVAADSCISWLRTMFFQIRVLHSPRMWAFLSYSIIVFPSPWALEWLMQYFFICGHVPDLLVSFYR